MALINKNNSFKSMRKKCVFFTQKQVKLTDLANYFKVPVYKVWGSKDNKDSSWVIKSVHRVSKRFANSDICRNGHVQVAYRHTWGKKWWGGKDWVK